MPLDILLVEDNVGDARLLKELLIETNRSVHLYVVSDGVEAMAFLRYRGKYIDVPRPDLILLDLNMDKMDGREVLARVEADPHLRAIPLIVLTTSQAEFDIKSCYKLMASCYLTKPEEPKEFEMLVKSLNEFWLTRVSLPRQTQTKSCLTRLPSK